MWTGSWWQWQHQEEIRQQLSRGEFNLVHLENFESF
jgi:hypothetical protein